MDYAPCSGTQFCNTTPKIGIGLNIMYSAPTALFNKRNSILQYHTLSKNQRVLLRSIMELGSMYFKGLIFSNQKSMVSTKKDVPIP